MTVVFTLCSNNYLAQAIVLGNSVLKHNPEYTFRICLVDKKIAEIDYAAIPFEITEIERVEIEKFNQMLLRYTVTELNTAVKPHFFKYLLARETSAQNFIYLDPDILLYKPLNELEEELKLSDIVITPHITAPLDDEKSPTENDFLNTGIYNLGFIALRRSATALQMLDWWGTRLETKAYNDVSKGMFTDQVWINFVPLFFDSVKVFKHPGYNMAYWNLHERKISGSGNALLVNGNQALAFFHFSGFNPLRPDEISRFQNRFTFSSRTDLVPVFNEYARLLVQNNYAGFKSHKCVYSGLKEESDEKRVLALVKSIPSYKRGMRKIINGIVSKFNIVLDYQSFYNAKDL